VFQYSMQLFWSDEDSGYIALVPEFPHLSAFGDDPEEAAREAQVAASLLEEVMAEQGETFPEPQVLSSFSGQLRVRMPRTLHQKLAGRARMEDVSLNTLMVSLLAESIGAMEQLPLVESRARRPKGSPRGASGASGAAPSEQAAAVGS
jgi:predicted RNase H-like HicB family nuclease